MKKKIIVIFSLILLMMSGCENSKDSTSSISELYIQTIEQLQIESTDTDTVENEPINYEIQKSIWLTMLDYENLMNGKNEKEFTDEISKAFDKIKSCGFNTVYAHIRPYNDAYYQSEIFPPAKYNTGNYDPLKIMISLAHEREISIHGWINPLRCQTEEEIKNLDDNYTINIWYNDSSKNGTYIVLCDDRFYLNPAYEDVRNYIFEGIKELSENYQLDGIHIDDYFYPTTDESFDKKAFSESGETNLKSWRTENINLMVKGIYNTIKNVDEDILFGISPQGNIDTDYNTLFADVEKWASEEGFCDYIVPQLYYGFKNENLPFEKIFDRWNKLNDESNVKLVAGICLYKIGNEDKWAGTGKNEWKESKGIPAKQAKMILESEDCGTAVYSYGSLINEEISTECQLLSEVLNEN